MVVCPGGNLSMTAHTLKYIHKRKGYCKAIPPKEKLQQQGPLSAPRLGAPKAKLPAGSLLLSIYLYTLVYIGRAFAGEQKQ